MSFNSINVRQGDGLVSIIKLNECGDPALGAGGLLNLVSISEFGFEDTVEEGDEITERNFGGRKCYSDVGQDEITNIAINMTVCGVNVALDSFLTGSALKGTSGYGRRDLAANTNVAVQVLMRLDTDACDGSGEAPIAGWLFPLIKNWRPAAATTLNGSDLVKPQYTGRANKNPNIFDTVPEPLEHWETVLDEANEWYAFNLFDAADVPFMPAGPIDDWNLTELPESLDGASS